MWLYIAQVVFYVSYFVAWLTSTLPRDNVWVTVSAIAAVIIAALLVLDGYRDNWGRTRV